jgi:hypothetical protein
MSLTINLETEDGKILTSICDNNLLQESIPTIEDEKFYCLKYIDLYGDTVFNRLQMDDLIKELLIVKAESKSTDLSDFIGVLVDLAKKCKNDVHLYLKFYGD